MQIKYDMLIINKIQKFNKYSIDQYVLIAKQVFKCKQDIDGNIKKYKACQVVKNFKQGESIDYFEIFAVVIKPQTNKIFFVIIVKKNLYFYQVDMVITFLNLCLEKRVYIE